MEVSQPLEVPPLPQANYGGPSSTNNLSTDGMPFHSSWSLDFTPIYETQNNSWPFPEPYPRPIDYNPDIIDREYSFQPQLADIDPESSLLYPHIRPATIAPSINSEVYQIILDEGKLTDLLIALKIYGK